ncbi:hypothetical protein ACIRRH_36685 [Kitasatospora sp. NPDC101235]|uniref:hypothetical protein n=1 Tax=Kitasatospora sp. NPDC101235 TaxID=3364101 RepID=UPI0038202426
MPIDRRQVIRGRHVAVATLIGSVLVPAGAQSPAQAAETEWGSFYGSSGKPARGR